MMTVVVVVVTQGGETQLVWQHPDSLFSDQKHRLWAASDFNRGRNNTLLVEMPHPTWRPFEIDLFLM